MPCVFCWASPHFLWHDATILGFIMIIDILVASTLIVFGIWGLRRGLIRQIALIAAIVMGYMFASPVADILASVLTDHYDILMPPRYLHVLLVSISATAIFVIVTLIGGFLHKTLIRGIKPAEHINKAFGFTAGLLSAGFILYFILCLANCGSGWLTEYTPNLAKELEKSIAYGITQQFNLVEERLPELAQKTEKPAKTASSPKDSPPPVHESNPDLVPSE